ncbi:hypothetical protein E24_00469 [Faustovirus]|nr:hypothetical protein PRJ_Fausto_00441 [Faustovirus]AMN83382.1 hypothetical protein E24_00469 [Faustovirus]AMN84366.1 hypothetical protein D5a_00467 [Faustovirus]AMN85352.1 hypothetical protein E23_00469 [Faustovirus]QBR99346.1 hypothetical protein [Faustovirus mariensis]
MYNNSKVNSLITKFKSSLNNGQKRTLKMLPSVFPLGKGISICVDGFISNYLDVIEVVKDLRCVIIMLANDVISFNDLAGDLVVFETREMLPSREIITIGKIARVDLISWKDICEILYDFMIENTKCKIVFRADTCIDNTKSASVHVEFGFDITTGKIKVSNKGRIANEIKHRRDINASKLDNESLKFKTKFVFDSCIFYDIDNHGDELRGSNESFDDSMEMFFKSRGSNCDSN